MLDGDLACNYLDAEQLVKHSLALHSRFPEEQRTLVYLFWEPANASELPELAGHIDELGQLVELLGEGADPTFVVRTYDDLFAEWGALPSPATAAHVEALTARYGDVTV